MSDVFFDFEGSPNEATGISAFGGHRLPGTTAVAMEGAAADEAATTLGSLGIEDAEQLVAIAAIPDARARLDEALGHDVDVAALLEEARALLPEERAVLVSRPAPVEFGMGVLPPTPEMLAAAEAGEEAEFMVTADEAAALPASVNLIPRMPPIRNQGPRGTCVSFTLTALNEYVLRRKGLLRDLSEQHLYYEIKLIDGSQNGCGTWQVKAVTALRNRGQCREGTWAYNPNPPCNNHGPRPPGARPEGVRYRLNTIQVPAKDVMAYKRHLAQGRPVTLSIPVYNSWLQSPEVKRSGRITMRLGGEPAKGGHAVCVVGYQDSATSPGGGYFLVRNSWHTTWAYDSPYGAGNGTIPYAYISNEAWEAFTADIPGPVTEDDLQDEEDGLQPPAHQEKTTVTIEAGKSVKITITQE